MPDRRVIDHLDDAVSALLADPGASLPGVEPGLAPLLHIAAGLRDLPRAEFKARLRTTLLSVAGGHGAPMVAHDVTAALAGLSELTMRFFGSLNRCTLGVSRFSEGARWERHPAGDELLHFLAGDADVVTLTGAGPVTSTVHAGSLFVCPRGLWHRVVPRSPVSLLFATPGEGTEHATDPPSGPRPVGAAEPVLVAHDLRAAVRGLSELAITPSTTAEEADAAVRVIASLDDCTLGVMRFSGETPWERHPGGDELLHPLEGDVDVTVLTDDGSASVTVRAGSVFVCPRGLWHRQRGRPAVTELFATPTATTEASWAEDPRRNAP